MDIKKNFSPHKGSQAAEQAAWGAGPSPFLKIFQTTLDKAWTYLA